MGQVWQSHDTQLNRDVALKILPDAFATDPDRLARFQREAQVLASLNHPNIAQIHGIEQSEDTRALVLELVEGPTLAELIAPSSLSPTGGEGRGEGALPLDDALAIATQIADALVAAHEAGIIHRDLKPANIKVRADGTVKVLDFGLAKRLPDSGTAESQATTLGALTHAGRIVGTPAYMAPEQILGQEADARSDIFSFGVVLYELLAGAHPFLKGTTSDTMAAVVRDPPTPPTGGVGLATHPIFDKLLAKEARDRYQTAAEVRTELHQLREATAGRTAADVEEASRLATGGRRTPYVGRETERAELVRRVEQTVRGRGGMVLIGGEPGVGKTRLVEQVLDTAKRRRCLALTGRCYEMAGTPPLIPFIETLEHYARVVPIDALGTALGDAAPEVARLAPDLRRLFPDMPAPLVLPPEQQGRFLFKSYGEFLERASRARPLVLLFDDLQWADEATLQLLQHVAPLLAEMPMLVLGTYRDVELDARRPFAATLETLTRKRLADPLPLAALPQPGVEAMLSALGGPSPPAALVTRIYRETEGNPFFVEEVFRYLQQEVTLVDGDGHWQTDLDLDELDVPDGVRAVVGRRLSQVSPESQRVLTLGAIVGRSFSLELLEAIADVTGDALLTALEEAEEHVLIVPVSKRDARWEFSHGLIRQTLAAGLSVPRRQRLHLRVAQAIEHAAGDASDVHASELAHHYYEAGTLADQAKTVRYLIVAGKHGLDTGAPEDALRRFDLALALLPTDDQPAKAEVLWTRASAHRSLGQFEESIENWKQALSVYEDLGNREAVAAIHMEMNIQLGWMGRASEMRANGQRGLQVVGPEASAARIRMLMVVGGGLIADTPAERRGSDETSAQAVAMAKALGDARVRQDVHLFQAYNHFWRLRYPQQAESALMVEQLARASGDLWPLADALALFQLASVWVGRLDGVARAEDEAERLAERLGHIGAGLLMLIARGQRNWLVAADLDHFEAWVPRVVELCARVVPWGSVHEVWLTQASIARGRWDEARDRAQEAVRSEPLLSHWGGHNWGVLFLSECLLGHKETALALLDERRDLLPSAGYPNTIGAWTLLFATIEGLAVLGEREVAAELYLLTVEAIETGTVVSIDARRLLQTVAGIAASAGGQWEQAETHYQTALTQAHEIPFRSEQPEVRRWYAQMLLDRNAPGDRDKAHTLLGEAIETYQQIGMPRHVEMAQEMLKKA